MRPLYTTSSWWIWISLLLLASCREEKLYTDIPGGGQWRLHAFDNSKEKLDSAELLYLDAAVLAFRGSETLAVHTYKPFEKQGDQLWNLIRTRFIGDSLEFISVKPDFLRPENQSDTLRYYLSIRRQRTRADLADRKLIELAALDSLVRRDSIRVSYSEHKGIYLKRLGGADTNAVRQGREIVLHYRGMTLDGRVFDDTRRMEGPLRFTVGNEMQVIPGIDAVLPLLHKGEKARIIIPSWLAFGSRGTAGGHVPPYTTVVYDLEIVELGK